MKKYMVLHAGEKHTNYFLAESRQTIRIKCSLQGWSVSDTVTCELINGRYTPILFPNFDRLIVQEAYDTMSLYLANYYALIERMPINAPYATKFFKKHAPAMPG